MQGWMRAPGQTQLPWAGSDTLQGVGRDQETTELGMLSLLFVPTPQGIALREPLNKASLSVGNHPGKDPTLSCLMLLHHPGPRGPILTPPTTADKRRGHKSERDGK